jgi:hypothetical protein
MPKELEPVANLPGLDVVTSDGRCSLVVCARCTFGHLRRRKYSHMTNGSFVKDDESRKGNGWSRGDDRSSGESFFAFVMATEPNFVFALGRSPLRPQEHVHDQIGSFRHEIPGIFGTEFRLIRFVDHGELVVRIVCVVPTI